MRLLGTRIGLAHTCPEGWLEEGLRPNGRWQEDIGDDGGPRGRVWAVFFFFCGKQGASPFFAFPFFVLCLATGLDEIGSAQISWFSLGLSISSVGPLPPMSLDL